MALRNTRTALLAPSIALVLAWGVSVAAPVDETASIRQSYLSDGAALPTPTGDDQSPIESPLPALAWHEEALRVTDGSGFGNSVAVSGDTALIGAYSTDTYQGAVYVYQRSPACFFPNVCGWARKQRVVASDAAAGAAFGSSVAFDGTTAFVGAPTVTVNGRPEQGAVYVFTRGRNGTLVQAQKLTAPDGVASDCFFGRSVAIAGADALVGAPGCSGTNQVINSRGSAYRYRRDANGTWTIAQKFVASDGGFAETFGGAVAISNDTAIIGAPNASQFGYYGVGAVYVYKKQCFSNGRCNSG